MKHAIPFIARHPRIAVIRLSGVIGAGRRGRGLNDAALAPVIERAFRKGRPTAVALAVNSPGGAPVQTALIAARLRRLADERGVPLHAFVEDVAASGGYWLASAADAIWADEASVLGSIGVISSSFGLHEFIARHGVERRVHTAGMAKSFLDPFQPERPEDVARLGVLQRDIHDAFVAQIRARRGERLATSEDLFNGSVWTGRRAVELGLADGLAHLVPKMKEIFGDKARFVTYGPRRGLMARFGISGLVAEAVDEIAKRGLWARYGL